jgi:glycosyltransferase involved in cell wall biosynthesis
VIPSLFEGTPVSLIEAMFNGLPIIGANIKGINNIITQKKNGLLFEKGNINDLKNKIRDLVNNIDLASKLGKSVKNDYSRGYKFENVVSDHLSLFKKVVGL